MNKNINKKIIPISILGLVLIFGIIYFVSKGNKSTLVEDKKVVAESSVSPISKDNSFDTIEKELDSTVILEEDFSDL